MEYPLKHNIPFEEIENGALVLWLLTECKTWQDLCSRYAYADPAELVFNSNTMMLRDKLFQLRDLGLIGFEHEGEGQKRRPVGEIKDTGLWASIRVGFGGMSLTDAALVSRHSKGMA